MRPDRTARRTDADRPAGGERPGLAGSAAAVWGVLGTTALLLNAIWRLAAVAVQAFTEYRLAPWHWAFAVAGVAFMGLFEGYKGFQLGFSPRVVVRAAHLARHPRLLHALLAPMFCMGLIHASRRRLVASWIILAMVTALVVAMRYVPQPLRGIIDLGVVVGLVWGVVALGVLAALAAAGRPVKASADLPAGPPP